MIARDFSKAKAATTKKDSIMRDEGGERNQRKNKNKYGMGNRVRVLENHMT